MVDSIYKDQSYFANNKTMNLTLNLPQTLKMSQEQFAELAQMNQDVRLELTAKGELIIMPPTGGETGARNSDLTGQIWLWNRQKKPRQSFRFFYRVCATRWGESFS
jgi:Uma2 family endonuclease